MNQLILRCPECAKLSVVFIPDSRRGETQFLCGYCHNLVEGKEE